MTKKELLALLMDVADAKIAPSDAQAKILRAIEGADKTESADEEDDSIIKYSNHYGGSSSSGGCVY